MSTSRVQSQALFDNEGYRLVKFVREKRVPVKTAKEQVIEAIRSRSSEISSSELSSPSSTPPRTPRVLRESIEEDDSSDVTLFAKYKVYESGSTSTRCVQIEIDSESTVLDMKNAFYEATGIKKAGMKFYHVSYSNGMKFGLGDIKKEDGKVGRFLDPFNDSHPISSHKIENGSMFEIEIPK